MRRLILCFTWSLFYCVSSQTTTLDELIHMYFTRPTTEPSVNCSCVPSALCNNGKERNIGAGVIMTRIDTKCNNPLEVCCQVNETVSKPTSTQFDPPKSRSCGLRNVDGVNIRISSTDDSDTLFGEFPWMISLFRKETKNNEIKYDYKCGGSLIHPQVVLTAAHCVPKAYNYTIRAGEWDINTTKEMYPHHDRDVKTIIIHPKYYAGGVFYDFALLIFDSPLELSDYINVVCLPSIESVEDNSWCYATGWGNEEFKGEKLQSILKKVELPIINRKKCVELLRKTRLGSDFELHETFICAGAELGKDTCKGDGGSPLVCPIVGDKDKYFQAGIVSWGINCGGEEVPGVYANVVKAIDWIDDQMTLNGFDTFPYRY